MSRSYRRPYAAITGVQSANWDKQQAALSVRRRINEWLHIQHAKAASLNLSLTAWSANTMTYGAGTATASSACSFLMRANGRAIAWK